MSPALALGLETDRYAPGDTVRGTVTVSEGGRSRRLEVLLTLTERTANLSHAEVLASSGPLAEGELEQGGSYAFELRLPEDAVPGLSSPNGELYWEVDAKSDELGPDTHTRARITVAAPGG